MKCFFFLLPFFGLAGCGFFRKAAVPIFPPMLDTIPYVIVLRDTIVSTVTVTGRTDTVYQQAEVSTTWLASGRDTVIVGDVADIVLTRTDTLWRIRSVTKPIYFEKTVIDTVFFERQVECPAESGSPISWAWMGLVGVIAAIMGYFFTKKSKKRR